MNKKNFPRNASSFAGKYAGEKASIHQRKKKPHFGRSSAAGQGSISSTSQATRESEQEEPVTEGRSTQEEQINLLPGIKPVLELLQSSPEKVDTVFLRKGRHGKDMDSILDLCRKSGIRFSLMDAERFSGMYSGNSQGVIARLFSMGFVEPEDLFTSIMDSPMPLIVALDQVMDPGNAGTIARTLYALGGAGLLVPRHNSAYLGAAAAKAAAGALEHLPVARVGNLGKSLEIAKKSGISVYGAVASNTTSGLEPVDMFDFTPRFPAILVLGGEADGIRLMVEKKCDELVTIPMLRDFDSLNVAQSGAMLLSVFLRHTCK